MILNAWSIFFVWLMHNHSHHVMMRSRFPHMSKSPFYFEKWRAWQWCKKKKWPFDLRGQVSREMISWKVKSLYDRSSFFLMNMRYFDGGFKKHKILKELVQKFCLSNSYHYEHRVGCLEQSLLYIITIPKHFLVFYFDKPTKIIVTIINLRSIMCVHFYTVLEKNSWPR